MTVTTLPSRLFASICKDFASQDECNESVRYSQMSYCNVTLPTEKSPLWLSPGLNQLAGQGLRDSDRKQRMSWFRCFLRIHRRRKFATKRKNTTFAKQNLCDGIRKPRCMRTLFTKAQGIWKKTFCPGHQKQELETGDQPSSWHSSIVEFLSKFEIWYIMNISCIYVFLLCSSIFGISVFQCDQGGSVQRLAHLDICVLRRQKLLPRSGKTYWHACPCSRLMLRSLNGKQAITSRTKYVANDRKIFDAPG